MIDHNKLPKMKLTQPVGKHLVDPTLDTFQSFIDDFTSPILENVPILKGAYGIFKAGMGIKDRLLLKKMILMLVEVGEIDDKTREKWINGLESDEGVHSFGEKLLLSLDTLDDNTKAVWLGRALKEFISGRIDRNQFNKIKVAIQTVYVSNIDMIREIYSGQHGLPEEVMHNALSAGLAKNQLMGIGGDLVEFDCVRCEFGEYFFSNIAY